MLHLRVFGAGPEMRAVADSLEALPGALHVICAGAGDGSDRALVMADLQEEAVEPALESVERAGIPVADVSLIRVDAIQRGPLQRATLMVWADLLGQAGEYARPAARYLVFMAVAGIIAAYGVIYDNEILIVGAMAVSPDLLPVTAVCVGLVVGRGRLVGRALWTLAAGLGTACVTAGVLTAVLDLFDLLPSSFEVDAGVLEGLTTVNSSTLVVALAAGVAGMLALETRASSAVGVAISVTTIPASAYLGVAGGAGDAGEASGALLVLVVNVVALIAGGTATLTVQRARERRVAGRRSA